MKLFNKNSGFTLIEIIIALTLLVIIVPAFTGAIISSLNNEEDMNQRLEANRISNSIIETLKSDSYQSVLKDISEGSTTIDWNEDESIYNGLTINFDNNKNSNTDIIIKITAVNKTNIEDLYNIKLDWKNINYSLETLIAGED